MKKMTYAMAGLLGLASFAWSADKVAVPSVPGQAAVGSPTPQPYQNAMDTKGAPEPSAMKTSKDGVPTLVVEFEMEHADIPPAYLPQVDAFGNYLKAHPESTAVITGHADSSGHAPANDKLAQKRADAVLAYLVNHFTLPVTRIKAEGYGAVTDKATNSTVAGRQASRRAYGEIKTGK